MESGQIYEHVCSIFFFFKKVTKLKELKIGTNVIIWQIKNNIPSL
jgi:hypothetical protein